MKKTILIIGGFQGWTLSIAEAIRKDELSNELIFIPGNVETKSLGQNLLVPFFGENDNVSDCKDIEDICKKLLVDVVLFTPEHFDDSGLKKHLKENEKTAKVEVISPIHGYDGGAAVSLYLQQIRALVAAQN